MNGIIVSLFNVAAGAIMRVSGIPFISYNNIGTIIFGHPLGALGLVILLLLLILLVYVQFSIQFVGVARIQAGERSMLQILREALASLQVVNPRILLFFLGYFLLILPFGKYVFASPLLAKVTIPAFTMEFFLAKPLNMVILIAFYALVFILGNRLILVLPHLILKKRSLRDAVSESLKATHGLVPLVSFFLYFGVIVFGTWLISQGFYYLFYGLQLLLDKSSIALVSAIVLMVLVEVVNFLALTLAGMLLFSFMLSRLGYLPAEVSKTRTKRSLGFRVVVGTLTSLGLLILLATNWVYMTGMLTAKPVTISHRGVNDDNGVQNSIPSLLSTNKLKPDYVEMDVQETADKQFVVFHDPTLANLAKINKAPQKMTLSNLTDLTLSENHHTAKLASFDDYLLTAEKLHQKLLVEIKTTALDPESPSNLTKRFLNDYGSRLSKDGDMIHSLNYDVVSSVKSDSPNLPVSFILPFNIVFPETPANAYTMEATTLDASFVQTAHAHNQAVYAWTVNSAELMRSDMVDGVDGIITDHLTLLKEQIKDYEEHPSYADRLYMFFEMMPTPGSAASN